MLLRIVHEEMLQEMLQTAVTDNQLQIEVKDLLSVWSSSTVTFTGSLLRQG